MVLGNNGVDEWKSWIVIESVYTFYNYSEYSLYVFDITWINNLNKSRLKINAML